jgi:hypothetical protein
MHERYSLTSAIMQVTVDNVTRKIQGGCHQTTTNNSLLYLLGAHLNTSPRDQIC